MPRKAYVGIDTSCYTTSLAVVDEAGQIVYDLRKLLPVEIGEHGLRQSEGIFHHVRQLPELLTQVDWSGLQVAAVGVSQRPRSTEGSYMPVFLAGVNTAQGLSCGSNVPLFFFSHQEGHLAAGLGTKAVSEPFLAIHLSGGTSEVLVVRPEGGGFSEELLAGSSDLSAGQMIDRVGVALGLPFPAGPHLEELALQATGKLSVPSSVQAGSFSFSGPCSAALRLIEQGEDPSEIAFATLRVAANALEKALRYFGDQTKLRRALLVGGVMNNSLIRQRLLQRLGRAMTLHFAQGRLSGDNAVGIAWLTRQRMRVGKDE